MLGLYLEITEGGIVACSVGSSSTSVGTDNVGIFLWRKIQYFMIFIVFFVLEVCMDVNGILFTEKNLFWFSAIFSDKTAFP
jgi:hypothetical protein